MFFLWVKIIKIKKISKIILKSSESLKFILIDLKVVSFIKATTKTVIAANIDETEEYLNINETTIQVKINNKLNSYDKAIKIPK